MDFFAHLAGDMAGIKASSPLVHHITNIVSANFSANALLALGASPLMSSSVEENADLLQIAGSLVLNTGTVDAAQLDAMCDAAALYSEALRPWVLDPVGAGSTRLRTAAAIRIIRDGGAPTVIRGNAAEIISLAQGMGLLTDAPDIAPCGIDSCTGSSVAAGPATVLSRACGSVVCVSGGTDYVTDGGCLVKIEGGSPLMARVTGMGCVATSIIGAFLTVDENPLSAACCAMAVVSAAGQKAASRCKGPGSFVPEFLDALYGLETSYVIDNIGVDYEEL